MQVFWLLLNAFTLIYQMVVINKNLQFLANKNCKPAWQKILLTAILILLISLIVIDCSIFQIANEKNLQ